MTANASNVNLIELYLRAAGTSEVPEQYHLWCCLALISAYASDRVWLSKFHGDKTFANLYVLFEGPGAIGKNTAISFMRKFVSDVIPMFSGSITRAGLQDFLSTTDGKVLLVMDEMSAQLGGKSLADDMIRHLTALFSGADPVGEATRTGGQHHFGAPCITAVLGSNIVWIRDVVSNSAVEGGFFARQVIVRATYDFSKRFYEPIYPKNAALLRLIISARLAAIAELHGAILYSAAAHEEEKQWYMTRAAPHDGADDAMAAWWKRKHDLVRKVAMCLCLAEGKYDLILHPRHVLGARKIVEDREGDIMSIMQEVGSGQAINPMDFTRELLIKHKTLLRTDVIKAASRRGLRAHVVQEAFETLMQAGLAIARPSLAGRTHTWAWMGDREGRR